MTLLPRRRWMTAAAAAALLVGRSVVRANHDLVRVGGTGSAVGGMRLLAELFNDGGDRRPRVVVASAVGSTGGIQALLRGELDLAVANREPNSAELAQRDLQAMEYARTPFVVAVNASLGVRSVSTEQLADLFSPGAVFVNGQRARPVLRPTDRTDTELMQSLSPKVAQAIEAASQRRGMLTAHTDVEAADLISNTPGAFGPSTLALIVSERRDLVPLVIDGIAPTLEHLASGRYRPVKRLLAISPRTPEPRVAQFLEFLRTPEARSLMLANGHLPSLT